MHVILFGELWIVSWLLPVEKNDLKNLWDGIDCIYVYQMIDYFMIATFIRNSCVLCNALDY